MLLEIFNSSPASNSTALESWTRFAQAVPGIAAAIKKCPVTAWDPCKIVAACEG